MKKFLIRLALQAVAGALRAIMKEVLRIQDDVDKPMRQIAQKVMLGDVWVGKGADAFVEAVNELATKDVAKLVQSLTTYRGNVDSAMGIIKNADERVKAKVQELSNDFQAIL